MKTHTILNPSGNPTADVEHWCKRATSRMLLSILLLVLWAAPATVSAQIRVSAYNRTSHAGSDFILHFERHYLYGIGQTNISYTNAVVGAIDGAMNYTGSTNTWGWDNGTGGLTTARIVDWELRYTNAAPAFGTYQAQGDNDPPVFYGEYPYPAISMAPSLVENVSLQYLTGGDTNNPTVVTYVIHIEAIEGTNLVPAGDISVAGQQCDANGNVVVNWSSCTTNDCSASFANHNAVNYKIEVSTVRLSASPFYYLDESTNLTSVHPNGLTNDMRPSLLATAPGLADFAGKTSNTLIGAVITLSLTADGGTPTNFSWTIEGEPVQHHYADLYDRTNYVTNANSTITTNIQPDLRSVQVSVVTTNASVNFFWWKTGTYKVTGTCWLKGKQIQQECTFVVKKPDIQVANDPQVNVGRVWVFTNDLGVCFEVGTGTQFGGAIRLKANDVASGALGWAQIVLSSTRTLYYSNGDVDITSASGLDGGAYPTSYANPFLDQPGRNAIPNGVNQVTMNDTYRLFRLFKPPLGYYAPAVQFDWGYNITANFGTNGWQTSTNMIGAPTLVPAILSLPTWDRVVDPSRISP